MAGRLLLGREQPEEAAVKIARRAPFRRGSEGLVPLSFLPYSAVVSLVHLLGVAHVFAPEAELLGELVDHVLEDDRIHVLAEQIEEEPVADHRLLYDHVEALSFDPPKPAPRKAPWINSNVI